MDGILLSSSKGHAMRPHARFKTGSMIQWKCARKITRKQVGSNIVYCTSPTVSVEAVAPAARLARDGVLGLLCRVIRFLKEPPGGHPVGPVTWLPGWHQSLERGPRRWLGLLPGRRQPVPVSGAWYTPSGIANALRQVPMGVWCILAAYLGFRLLEFAKERRKERDKWIQERTLIAAAKSSDLLIQKNRMLRALGSEPVEVEAVDALPVDADEVQWQDPAEWQPVTWKQWADFMQKSRAMQLRKDKWWDMDMMENVPHHKMAYDKLESSGKLPDYNV